MRGLEPRVHQQQSPKKMREQAEDAFAIHIGRHRYVELYKALGGAFAPRNDGLSAIP
jgi:hypothetical protein